MINAKFLCAAVETEVAKTQAQRSQEEKVKYKELLRESGIRKVALYSIQFLCASPPLTLPSPLVPSLHCTVC